MLDSPLVKSVFMMRHQASTVESSFANKLFPLMAQRPDVNPISEHSLYLRLIVTNSGGV